MTIIFSYRIYQHPLICRLGSVIYDLFMNHTCVFSFRNSCTRNCAHFYARLINKGNLKVLKMVAIISGEAIVYLYGVDIQYHLSQRERYGGELKWHYLTKDFMTEAEA